MRAPVLFLGAAFCLAAVPATAQEATDTPAQAATPVTPDPAEGGNSVTVGVGAALVPTYLGSDHNRFVAAPQARGEIDGYAFAVRGTRLYVDIVPNEDGPTWDYQFGPVLSLDFNRVGNPEDAQVDALGRKKVAFEAGGFVGIGKTGVITSDYDKLTVSAAFVQDVSGVHKSFLLTPEISYGTPLSRRAYVGLSASATYAGSGYYDSYFGITQAQSAASGLARYNPGKGFRDWTIAALAAYSITGDLRHGLQAVGGVSYSRLLNYAARSPITSVAGTKNQLYYALGLAYTF